MNSPEQELRQRLAAAAGDWVEGAAAAAGPHPDVDELVAYRGGGLSEDEQRRVQDHLVVCGDCLDQLRELDDFLRAEMELEEQAPEERRTASNAATDLGTAAAWRALSPRLRSAEAGAPEGVQPRPATGPRPRPWMAALAASLAVAVVALTLFALQQRRDLAGVARQLEELSRPQPGAAIVDLYPSSAARGADRGTPVAQLPPAPGYATLVVNLPEGTAEAGYEAEIVDAEGRPLWSGGGLAASRYGTLRLGLPGGFLPPGDHALHLYAVDGEERHWIETYPLRVPEP